MHNTDLQLQLAAKGMEGLAAEDAAVLHAGLLSSEYLTVDDTGAFHTHNLCDATRLADVAATRSEVLIGIEPITPCYLRRLVYKTHIDSDVLWHLKLAARL